MTSSSIRPCLRLTARAPWLKLPPASAARSMTRQRRSHASAPETRNGAGMPSASVAASDGNNWKFYPLGMGKVFMNTKE